MKINERLQKGPIAATFKCQVSSKNIKCFHPHSILQIKPNVFKNFNINSAPWPCLWSKLNFNKSKKTNDLLTTFSFFKMHYFWWNLKFSCCFSLLLKCWKQKIICWSISPNPMWLSYLYCNILVVTPVTQLRYALLFTNVLKTKSEERPKGQQMLFTKSKYDLNISEKKTWLHWFFSRLGSKCLLWWINVAY